MLEIEIDTLTLEGMTETEGRRAARAFEQALRELFETHGLPEGMAAADLTQIELPDLPINAKGPEQTGRALAQAMFTELVR